MPLILDTEYTYDEIDRIVFDSGTEVVVRVALAGGVRRNCQLVKHYDSRQAGARREFAITLPFACLGRLVAALEAVQRGKQRTPARKPGVPRGRTSP